MFTERGALDMAIATLQRRVRDRDAEIERLRAMATAFLNEQTEANAESLRRVLDEQIAAKEER